MLPQVIASLNALSLILLAAGFAAVKRRRIFLHRGLMVGAVISSTLFLAVYLIHHYQVGSVAYPHHDWTRPVYFFILIPHIILAVLMLPFIVMALKSGAQNNVARHKRIVRYLLPVWMYVSCTGLLVYFMLYS